MEKNEHKELEIKVLEERIDRKIAEAKFQVTEKRLHYFMAFAAAILTIFGVFIPLLWTYNASEKVDTTLSEMRNEVDKRMEANRNTLEYTTKDIRTDVSAEMDRQTIQLDKSGAKVDYAVKDMQNQFKELAGMQLRQPNLECYVGGVSLEGAVIRFSNRGNNERLSIIVKNTGDATTSLVKLSIYTNIFNDYGSSVWTAENRSDEPAFAFVLNNYFSWPLYPKESRAIDFGGFVEVEDLKSGNYPAVLKVYYEQSEPKVYKFTINVIE